MKKFLVLLCLLPSLSYCQGLGSDEKEYTYPRFAECGLVTRWASNSIPPSCLTEALNVYLDEDLSAYRRRGSGQYNTTPCTDAKAIRGLWKYDATDGQKYIIIFSSQSFFYTKNQGDCTAISGASGLNATAEYECVQALGKLWCLNGIDPSFSLDSTLTYSTYTPSEAITTSYPSMPLGTKIGTFRNRLVVSGVSGKMSRILLSGEGDGTDWVLVIPGRSTSPSNQDISGVNDGNPVTSLMGQYQNAFYIGRNDDLYALSGNDRRDFVLRQISSQIGVMDGRSVKEKDNCLVWLSRRGVERMCGTTIDRASDVVRPLVDTLIQSAGNTRTKTYNSQDEWEAGQAQTELSQQGPTSTTIYPGSVVPSTWQFITTEGAHWAAGTLVNIDTVAVNGSIMLSIFERFSDNDYTNNPTWTPEHGTWDASNGYLENTTTGTYGYSDITTTATIVITTFTWSAYMIPGAATSWRFYPFSGVLNVLVTQNNNNYTYLEYSGNLCAVPGVNPPYTWLTYSVSIATGASNIATLTTKDGSCSGTFLSTSSSKMHFVAMPELGARIKDISIGMYSTGTWTSPIYDTTFSTPIGGPFYSDEDVPTGSTVAYQIRQSSYNSTAGMDSWITVSTTTYAMYRVPLTKRYWQEQILLSTDYSTQTPVVNMTALEATVTSYYIGDCIDTSGVTSWGNFRPSTQLTGASAITYAISTGTSCNEVTRSTADWVAQNANSPISASTAPYLGFRVFEIPYTTTDTIRLDALTAEWNEGSSRPPVASVVYMDRYYMFFTTDTASGSVNDHALVLDMNNKWTLLDHIYAYSAVVYENVLYTGDSNDTGIIRLQDIGVDDVGVPYTFRIKTSDYDFGNPIELKKLKRIYLMLKSEEKSGQNIEINVRYYIDGSTVAYDVGMADLNEATESGYFVAKFPVPNSQQNTFHWIKIEVEYAGKQGPLHVYGIKAVYTPIRWE